MAFPYMNTASPQCRPIESYTTTNTKGPDPLSDNWSYDSAIDLFTLNTMMPDTFALDLPEDMMNLEPKEFANVNPFSQPPGISGFAISDHSAEDSVSCGSMSSDHEDEQSWSPTYRMISPLDSPVTDNMLSKAQTWGPETQHQQQQQESRRKISSASSFMPKQERWSSSPELMPQDYSTAQMTSPVMSAQTVTPTPTTTTATTPAATTTTGRKMSRTPSDASPQNASSRNAAKRAAHNIIEKRYRTNMNAKFVALEKAMSSNGVAKASKSGSTSLKKSEILTNAIAYIQELQEENRAIHKELSLLKQNLLPGGIWRHTAAKRN